MGKSSTSDKKKRILLIIEELERLYPDAHISLGHDNPFELLIATILSSQCTDDRVNKVTAKLFKKYRKPEEYIAVPIEELESDIYSTGYYKAKARKIQAACSLLIEKFGGKVPGSMDELLELPGVGRKTANVVLSHSFGIPGVVVDTHVSRITQLLGLVESAAPEKIEQELMKILTKSKWTIFTHYLIYHGRAVCVARKPKCPICSIAPYCPSALK